MNKKFLSALFLGSIVMAGGTFTACSDYDDDINKLNERVDAVEQAIADLEAAIKAGSTITSVTPTDNGVIVNLSNGTSFELTNGKDGQSGTTGSVITIGANGNWFIDGVDTGKPSRGEAGAPGADGQDGVSGKYYIPGEDGYWIEVTPNADGTETKVTTSMSWAIDGIVTAAWDSANGYLYLDNVAGQTGVMVISLTDDLKSLVFVPDFYYEGIEAMKAPTFNYDAMITKPVDADGDYDTDAPTYKVPSATSVTPGLIAQYHMNPTSANVNDIKKLTYIAEDKEYVTRAAGDVVTATPYDWKAENGILTVYSHLTDGTIKSLSTGDEVTVLALQAHYNTSAGADTIITSDYAAVMAVNYTIGKIAYAKDANTVTPLGWHQDHLWDNAADAIANPAHYKIVYNSEGVDLDELVRTHVIPEGATTDEPWDVTASDGVAEDYGFEYSYDLVGYYAGNNETSESAHAIINDENILKPCMPVNGQQPTDFDNVSQKKAENGRMPLVRVTLKDTTSGEIAAVGYMKFLIVDEAVKDEVIHIAPFTFTDPFTVDCTKDNEILSIKWHDFEEDILAELDKNGISKEDFETLFTLDYSLLNATQFDGTTETSVAIPTADMKGIVSQTTADVAGHMTEVLQWVWANNAAYQWFKNNTSATVNVRYSMTTSAGANLYVYVTFTWTPSEINVTPAGEISNNDKIKEYWYGKNEGVAGTGYSDIHANVQTVGEQGAIDDFKSSILNTFVGNALNVRSIPSVYTAFTNNTLNKEFFFVDPQGTDLTPVKGDSQIEYNIIVRNNGKSLYAYKVGDPIGTAQEVVTINGPVLEYYGKNIPTSYACDILNYADHSELGVKETFTAQIYIKAGLCDEVPFELKNHTFFAKFLRPITVKDPGETNFVDATTGGSKVPLVLDFVDWRDHDFDDATVTNSHNYYTYYGVQSVVADTNPTSITTNLNGGDLNNTKLADVTNNIKFDHNAPTLAQIQRGDFGELVYENNGTTVGDFQIKVPVTVTYHWGTIHTHVICKISKTIQN